MPRVEFVRYIFMDFPHQTRECGARDQQIRALLIFPNLPQRHSAWPKAVWFAGWLRRGQGAREEVVVVHKELLLGG